MSFRAASTPSDHSRGVDLDDGCLAHQRSPPERLDVEDSSSHLYRASSSFISFSSDDDGAKPPSIPRRDNIPEPVGRVVSFGSFPLSEPGSALRSLSDADDESSIRRGNSVCSSTVDTDNRSYMACQSSSRTIKASNAIKRSGTPVVEKSNADVSRIQRKVATLNNIFRVAKAATAAGEQELNLQHQANALGDVPMIDPEREFRLVPSLGCPSAEIVDREVNLKNNSTFSTAAQGAEEHGLNAQNQTNGHGDRLRTVPETEYRFDYDIECPSLALPPDTAAKDTMSTMDEQSCDSNLSESGMRHVNKRKSDPDMAVNMERRAFRSLPFNKWCMLAASIVILAGALIGTVLALGLGGSSRSDSSITSTTNSHSDSPTASPTTEKYAWYTEHLQPLSGDAIYDKQSPQGKAFDWMVNEDPGNLYLKNTTESELKERYILAVWFFAMNGEMWSEQFSFLSLNHLCSWKAANQSIANGITCDDDNRVTELDFSSNGLSGTIPDEIGFLSNLETLEVSNNDISGCIPSTLFQISSLQSLELGSNSLNGTLPGHLDSLSNLDVENNTFEGPLPILASNCSLRYLNLGGNLFTGSIPTSILNCKLLEIISIFDSKVEGTIPTDLVALPKLSDVRLFNNTLTGKIPQFSKAEKLETLILSNNKLTGSLDSFFQYESKDQSLSSGQNNNNVGTRPALEISILDANSLNGAMPTKLTTLQLTANELSGTIPSKLGLLSELNILNLASNALSGQIPTELGRLGKLSVLNLAINTLNGTVPSELGELSPLQTLHLQQNELTGNLDFFCAPNHLPKDLIHDCREITCKCCSTRCKTSSLENHAN